MAVWGDFGPAAYAFVDFLAAGKQRMWQVLPLNPTGYGNSPYSALSAFAGNPLLVSLELLVRDGLLAGERLQGLPSHEGPCDFVQAEAQKMPLLEEAAAQFLDHASDEARLKFQRFCNQNSSWLTDYAMFDVLRRRFAGESWNAWPREHALRDGDAMAALHRDSGARTGDCAGDPVLLQRAMVCAARLLCAAGDSHPGRCGDLCELRQRGRVDAP